MLEELLVNSMFFAFSVTKVAFSIRRIHHPSGAAPPGTPVRARFCKSAQVCVKVPNKPGDVRI